MHKVININGTDLVFTPFKGRDTASLGVFLKVGGRYETNNLKGIAHFLEHLLFKGSKHYSYRKIKREIEGRGGALNGFTSQESTGFYAHFLKKNLDITLDILLDMVLCPSLKADDVEKERRVILEEIKMYNDIPTSRVVMLLDKLLWPKHQLGQEVAGEMASVERITRKDLINFKDKYYQPSNIVVSCSGDFAQDALVNLINKKIKSKSAKVKHQLLSPGSLTGMHIDVERKKLEQAHLCVGFRSPSYLSSDRLTSELLNIIMGANMSSRLFEEVREKRPLCYDISTEVRKYRDSGAFIIHIGLDKSRIKLALGRIIKELKKIKEKKISLSELARAKDFFFGQSVMVLERPEGRMFFNAESHLKTGRINSVEQIKEKITQITPQQISEVARKIFNIHNICVGCVGDMAADTEKEITNIIRTA